MLYNKPCYSIWRLKVSPAVSLGSIWSNFFSNSYILKHGHGQGWCTGWRERRRHVGKFCIHFCFWLSIGQKKKKKSHQKRNPFRTYIINGKVCPEGKKTQWMRKKSDQHITNRQLIKRSCWQQVSCSLLTRYMFSNAGVALCLTCDKTRTFIVFTIMTHFAKTKLGF